MSDRAIALDGVPIEAPRYGRLTVDDHRRHRIATGEELMVLLDGVDVTGECIEADDVQGYVRLLETPVHLDGNGLPATKQLAGIVCIRARELRRLTRFDQAQPAHDATIVAEAPMGATGRRGHFTIDELLSEERATGEQPIVSCRGQDVTAYLIEGNDIEGWVQLTTADGRIHGQVTVTMRAAWRIKG